MPVPKLLRKKSSISVRILEENVRSQQSSDRTGDGSTGQEEKVVADEEEQQQDGGAAAGKSEDQQLQEAATDIEEGDTDSVESSGDETTTTGRAVKILSRERSVRVPRMSSRLMSMKRRGKGIADFHIQVDEEEFEFCAGDVLTVRGEGKDFYICRVLEDVLADKDEFRVAWYDRVEDNLYKVSFDDVCWMDSVITRVKLEEKPDSHYSLPKQYIKQTHRLLREALKEEKGLDDESEEDQESMEEEDRVEDEAISADDEGDFEPPTKKAKKTAAKREPKKKAAVAPRRKTPAEKKPPKEKKQKPQKARRRGQLVPNPEIAVLEKDPVFEEKSDVTLNPELWGLRAVLLGDHQMLQEAINDIDRVHNVHVTRSPDIKRAPIHYALLKQDHEAVKILQDDEKHPKKRNAKPRNISLTSVSTGSYNFYTFGHPVRDLMTSRGGREGNNAFLKDGSISDDDAHVNDFAMKKGVPLETLAVYYPDKPCKAEYMCRLVWKAVRNGHRKLAGEVVKKAIAEMGGEGFNFLHKEVLLNDTEPLSKFRVQSVTKKPYENQCILPIHCACINPNVKYIQALMSSVPNYNVADKTGRKPIHYAAACEGPGPLKYLLTRGADCNDVDLKGHTPLMIAARHGRIDNVAALLESKVPVDDNDDNEENDGEEAMIMQVNMKARNKHGKAAIHYAAKYGHEDVVVLLASKGCPVDYQTSAFKNNMTALSLGAQQGHLSLVQRLVNMGASPDIKLKQEKSATIYAAQNGHVHILSYLLNIGCDANLQDNSQNSVLHYAAAYGWYHCVELLLKAGANPSAPNNWKTTPLAIALLKGNTECADLIMNQTNVDVNFQDDTGRTLLVSNIMLDYHPSSVNTIKLLVQQKGADPNKPDMRGWTPLHFLASHSVFENPKYDDPLKRYVNAKFNKESSDLCVEIAEILLSSGAEINSLNESGQTPLMIAVLQLNLSLIKLLVQHGAKGMLGKEKTTGRTALHLLTNSKQSNIDLRELYPEFSSRDVNDYSKTVQEMSEKLMTEIMSQLLESKTDINAIDDQGYTPLMDVVRGKYLYMIEILLSNGADPIQGKDKCGLNLLHLMAQSCSDGIIFAEQSKEILQKFDVSSLVEQRDSTGFTPLLVAFETYAKGSTKYTYQVKEFIQVLLDQCKANLTAVVEKWETDEKVPRRDVYSGGLKRNPCETAKDKESPITGLYSCLHYLAVCEDVGDILGMVVDKLGKGHPLLNSRNRYGHTPLHLTLKIGKNKKAVEILANAGADVNAISGDNVDDKLASPLIMASRPGCDLSAAKVLLAAKADPNIVDKLSRSALSYAVMNNQDNESTPTQLVRVLLEGGADPNSVDNKLRTALHYAVNHTSGNYESLTEVEDLLVEYGADTAARDIRGRTPLHYAFVKMRKHTDYSLSDPVSISSMLCDAMKEQGKDVKSLVNVQDEFGQTPLHRAALRGATLSCIKIIQCGAEVNTEDNDKNTPLSLALREKHNGFAIMLLQKGAFATSKVVTPLTPEDRKNYKKKLEEAKWTWAEVVDLVEPKPTIKSAFRVAVETNNQGVAYLMLDVAKLDVIMALKAAFEAGRWPLIWTLLKKQRNKKALLGVDDKDCNLLHLLAMHAGKNNNEAIKVAKLLLELGVPVDAQDSIGATPLHYSACQHNDCLSKVFLENNPAILNSVDKDGCTPVAAVFSGLSEKISWEQMNLLNFFVMKEPETVDVCYKVGGSGEGNESFTTPLIQAVYLENAKELFHQNRQNVHDCKQTCAQFLLCHGASIDFPAKDTGTTAMMVAVLKNDEELVDQLLNFKPDLTLQDHKGWNVVHHCVQSKQYGSSENVKMLKKLVNAGAPLDVSDEQGHTPLMYARKQGSGVMCAALNELLGTSEEIIQDENENNGFVFSTTPYQYWKLPEHPNVSQDALDELELHKLPGPVIDAFPPVDKALNMQHNGEVYVDPETGVPYDIVMSKVDVKHGLYGLNNFYKMQVVHHKGKDLWLLFNRWGRVGDHGQHQQTPFTDPKDATSEFKKIFKSKSGNEWDKKDNFEKKPHKYALVLPEKNPERQIKNTEEALKPFELLKAPKSYLPEEMKTFMTKITDYAVLKQALESEGRIDTNFLPFGRLSSDTVLQAKNVLLKISAILEKIDMQNLHSNPDAENLFGQVAELSNEYYMLLPPAGYRYERIKPLNQKDSVDEQLRRIEDLTEMSHATRSLLAAQHRRTEVNPLDYSFASLDCLLELVDSSSPETQMILESFHKSHHRDNVGIKGIYRIQRAEEVSRMKTGVCHNRRLLWHGTKTAHMISILQQGLLVTHRGAFRTGSAFGEGIYFTFDVSKALGYISSYRSMHGFLLLCEVALGDMNILANNNISNTLPEGKHSTWLKTQQIPNPLDNCTTPYGALMSAGKMIDNFKDNTERRELYSQHECVVYDPAQVRLRYIIDVISKN